MTFPQPHTASLKRMGTSRKGIIIAALPSILMLGLFYSLAIHMHSSLGAWPKSIGERGFPPALVAHCSLTVQVYIALSASLYVLPIAILVCALVPRWRRLLVYLFLCGIFSFFSLLLTSFAAPSGFITWWMD